MARTFYTDGALAKAKLGDLIDNYRRMAIDTDVVDARISPVWPAKRQQALGELTYEFRFRCTHCKLRKDDHAPDGKCLFDATTFAPMGVPTDVLVGVP